MTVSVVMVPGAVSAGTAINLPSGMPKIGKIISATKITVDFSGSTLSTTTVAATKESDNSFSLDTDVTANDIIVLVYVPVTDYIEP